MKKAILLCLLLPLLLASYGREAYAGDQARATGELNLQLVIPRLIRLQPTAEPSKRERGSFLSFESSQALQSAKLCFQRHSVPLYQLLLSSASLKPIKLVERTGQDCFFPFRETVNSQQDGQLTLMVSPL